MPSPFITDNSRLPFPKSDRTALPAGANPAQHLTASEWNATCQAVIDTRAWIISGSYYGLLSQSSMPNVQIGLSGTVGAIWLSSSLHPYLSVTSSNGLVTRKFALAPTGTNRWTGYWNNVLVDEQGIIISGSYESSSGNSSTASLDFLTRDLTVQRNSYMSGTVLVATLTSSLGIKTVDLEVARNASFLTLTGSGGAKFLDLEVTRNATFAEASFVSLTSSMGVKTVDLEVTRNAAFLTLTGSGGAKFLDLEVTRTSILATVSVVTLTSSMGLKTVDLESTRTATMAAVSMTSLTASAGIKTSLDLESVRDLVVGRNTSTVSLTSSGGTKTTDLAATRYTTVAFLTCSNGSRFQGAYDEFNGDLTVNNKGGTNTFSVVCSASFLAPTTFTSVTSSHGIKTSLDLESVRNLIVGGNINVTQYVTSSTGRILSLTGSRIENTVQDTGNAICHIINATSPVNSSSAKLISVQNAGTAMFSIGPSGSSYFGSDAQPVLGFYHYFGQNPSTAKLILYADNSNGTVLQFPGQPTLQFAFGQATFAGKFVQQTGDCQLGGSSNKMGFYGNTPVSRPASYTMNAGITYRTLPSGSLVAQVEGVLRQVVDDLVSQGILTGTL